MANGNYNRAYIHASELLLVSGKENLESQRLFNQAAGLINEQEADVICSGSDEDTSQLEVDEVVTSGTAPSASMGPKKKVKTKGRLKSTTPSAMLSSTVDRVDSANQSKIEYSFINKDVENDFNRLKADNKKFAELLIDVQTKPWATEGSGRPEVLKGECQGHNGCISRRINRKDRLVYKVTGHSQILVISAEGHYNY